MISADLF